MGVQFGMWVRDVGLQFGMSVQDVGSQFGMWVGDVGLQHGLAELVAPFPRAVRLPVLAPALAVAETESGFARGFWWGFRRVKIFLKKVSGWSWG